jgi:acyl-CoA thioester hydrolase
MNFDGSSLAAGFPVLVTLPVQWGDQDAFGHVNNTVYFRWYESARIAYGRRTGMNVWKETQNVGPILASITCDFRRQVTFPDTIHVGARVTRMGRSSMTMEHILVSEAAGAVAAEGTSAVVIFDYNAGQSYPIPDEIRRAIEQLEGRTF